MPGSLACPSVSFNSLHSPPHCPFSPGTYLPLNVVQLTPVKSGFWKWGTQKERGMLQRMNCQRVLGISPGASAGGGHQWFSGEGQAPKLAELAVCWLCLEGWGKSHWILLLLPFSGGSPRSHVKCYLEALWGQEVDKPAFLQLRCRGEII